jgi:hypothetical protein
LNDSSGTPAIRDRTNESPEEAVIGDAWIAFGFEWPPHDSKATTPKRRTAGYGGLVDLVQTATVEKARRWVAHLEKTRPRMEGEGNAWKWFRDQFARGMHRDFEWQQPRLDDRAAPATADDFARAAAEKERRTR